MGNGKISPLVIVILMIILAGVAFVAVRMMNGETAIPGMGDKEKEEKVDLAVPVITLELSSEEEEQEEVIIYVKAKVSEGEEIESIILPDNTIITGSEAEYRVNQNGTYTFKAVTKNQNQSTSDIKVTNIRLVSADNPYIPDGFTYLGGDIKTGYVIVDSFGNEYVWVPCANGLLERETLLNTSYEESSDSPTELVSSVAKYYGFYIARYESSIHDTGEGLVAATRKNATPWTDVTYLDAIKASKASGQYFGYPDDVKTNMVSSYAWDTTLFWIDKSLGSSFSSSLNYGNQGGTVKPTGTTENDKLNGICDMAGNVREWTTEIYNGPQETKKKSSSSKKKNEATTILQRVVRGGSAVTARKPASRTAYNEDTSETYWGFRMVMYKF